MKMSLIYKDDWEETKERYRMWWHGEYFGRCGLWVSAPRSKKLFDLPPVPQAKDPVDYWTNIGLMVLRNEHHFNNTFFGGEAFPIWSPGYPGVSSITSFMGYPPTLDYQTGWRDPIMIDEDWDIRRLKVDKQNEWWKFTIDWLERAASECMGKGIPSIGAFGGCGDTLAAIRGTMNLLYDVIDCPDKVKDADEYLMQMWFDVYDSFYNIICEACDQGSTSWFNLWAPGKFYPSQNDFSYMISPRMFRDIFLSILESQTRFLDYSVYHVDGIGAFAHVPALCELPGLQAIQILPGAGKPSPLYYSDVLKTVQSAGKNLHISIPISEVEAALEMLSARVLFIETWASSEDEAKELLRKTEKWSKV